MKFLAFTCKSSFCQAINAAHLFSFFFLIFFLLLSLFIFYSFFSACYPISRVWRECVTWAMVFTTHLLARTTCYFLLFQSNITLCELPITWANYFGIFENRLWCLRLKISVPQIRCVIYLELQDFYLQLILINWLSQYSCEHFLKLLLIY